MVGQFRMNDVPLYSAPQAQPPCIYTGILYSPGTLIDSDAATPSQRGAASAGTRALGEALLVDMFLWQPHARPSLLAAAFSSMVCSFMNIHFQ